MNITGYPAELIYHAGDTARFMVSAETPRRLDAQLVRIVCGDNRATGPGYKEEEVAGLRKTGLDVRKQTTEIGSFMRVPGDGVSDIPVLGFILNVFATTPTTGLQAVVARWDDVRQRGFRLVVNEASELEVEVGDGAGKRLVLKLPHPVGGREWTTIALGIDFRSGDVRLMAKPVAVDLLFTDVQEATGRCDFTLEQDAASALTFAAFWLGRSQKPVMHGFFNGRLETPVLLARMPEASDLARYQGPTFPDFPEALAIWDFGRDFDASTVADGRGGRLNAELVNLPSRGVTASRWDGSAQNFVESPLHYAAVHFHDDDLEDCAWQETLSFVLPDDLRSGFYAARLRSADEELHVVFIVEERPGVARSKVAFLASSVTFVAYSNQHYDFDDPNMEMKNGVLTVYDPSDIYLNEHREIGMSPYDRHSDGYGVFYSSARRPLFSMFVKDKIWALNADTHITDWLEARKLDYDVISDHSVHFDGIESLARYQTIITGTHPEYWTTPMWKAMTRYLAQGGRLMYLGGNGFYWRTAIHKQKPWLIELRRVESGARYWESEPGEGYMNFTGEYGGLWRRAATPPQRLVGVGTVATGFDYCSYYRRRPESDDARAAFIFAGIENEILGDFGSMGGGASGLEIDRADPWLGTPAHALIVARSEGHTRHFNIVPEETPFHHPTVNGEEAEKCFADIVFFETGNGGAVFSTGSIAWATSLAHQGYENDVSRMTENVVRRFADPQPFPAPGPDSGSAELRRTRTDLGHEFYAGIGRRI